MNFMKAAYQAVTGNVENPVYEVTANHEDYEERHYPDTRWVSTTALSMSHKEAGSQGFWKLFNYIGGQNEKAMKIPMTAPVVIRVVPGQGPNCESTFTVSFFVGKAFHEDTPKPTNTDLTVETWPPMSVFVRRFAGFPDDETWIGEARALSESMGTREDFTQEFYCTAGYDSPFKLFNRRNEIWFIKK